MKPTLRLKPRRKPAYIKIDQVLYRSLREVFTQLRVAIVNAELQYRERKPKCRHRMTCQTAFTLVLMRTFIMSSL